MTSPLVSVVIPTVSSRKKYLERAVDSVLNQSYGNVELVVVNEGLSATVQRNMGIDRSNGDFIAFLDDDDIWHRDKLEKQLCYMDDNPDCSICICYSDDRRIGDGRVSRPPDYVFHSDLVRGFNLSSTSSYLVRRYALDMLKARDGFYFDESLPTGHEYDLALRITRFHPVVTVPEVLMVQNKSIGQISTNWNKKVRGQYCFMMKYGEEYSMLDYVKRVGLVFLFFMGNFVGDRVMLPINYMKDLSEAGFKDKDLRFRTSAAIKKLVSRGVKL